MIKEVNNAGWDWLEDLQILPKGHKQRSKGIYYLDSFITFDIETTNLYDIGQNIMYIWQCQVSEDLTVIGRTWDEYREFIKGINSRISNDKVRLVCYVHNLSYEFQYLKTVVPVDQVFALDPRKVLKFISGHIEYRCSYLHSNMSLDRFLNTLNVENKKTELDYSVTRYPWTVLTDKELEYCVNDVKGLRQALVKEMERDGDDLYTIPLTSTGYVRREARQALAGYRRYIHRILPDPEVFDYLRMAFRGGNTHANRYNSNKLISASEGHPINSYDISSSYPSVLMSEKYPGKFVEHDPKYFRLLLDQDRACLFQVHMFDVKLKDPDWGCPYISKSKCLQIDGGIFDNGRVLSADAISAVITEIDFVIMESEYDFDFEIVKLFSAIKQELPYKFKDLLMQMYRDKTLLKGSSDDYLYTKTKNKFNSYYGMCVQNPCKPDLILEDNMLIPDLSRTFDEMVLDYQQKGWLPYQWGVWCTAYARLKLERGLRAIPAPAFIYADTDSIKYIGEYDDSFTEINKLYKREDLSAVDRKGIRHYLGIFEKDNKYPILQFKTMGAKKYCYTDQEGLHLTVSGVSKSKGAAELGSIENFKEGFIFRDGGGTETLYNDDPEVKHITVEGHDLEITSNAMILDSTYTLGLTMEYRRLLNYLSNVDIKSDIYHDYDSDYVKV